jgi:hypothetical protein
MSGIIPDIQKAHSLILANAESVLINAMQV